MRKLPKDPKNYYIQNQVSLDELAALYKGQKNCSLGNLKRRCIAEKWGELRKDFHAETDRRILEKTAEKAAEKQASTLQELNNQHNELISTLIEAGKTLLEQHTEKLKDGKQKITCSPKDFKILAEAMSQLIRDQRLVHNYEPQKPMAGGKQSTGAILKLFQDIIGDDQNEPT